MNRITYVVVLVGLALLPASVQPPGPTSSGNSWSVTQQGNLLQINYGSGASFPQYAALDLSSSYFRMNPGPPSGWGTSTILLPVFWSQKSCPPPGLCQGAPVQAAWHVDSLALVLSVKGVIGGLQVADSVRIFPPLNNRIMAQVTAKIVGNVVLDNRPGEAFKPVMFSSMHISGTLWDTQTAYIGKRFFSFPASGWIIQPPVVSTLFGLQGGTSAWKTNAPTMQATFRQAMQITGYVTASSNPNDDNIGFWAAINQVLHSYSYTLTAAPASVLPTTHR